MRAAWLGLLNLFALNLLAVSAASAYDATDPANCTGIGWDDARPLTVARVTGQPRVNFVKSPYDDDFKAASCPAPTEACRKKSYLVSDDWVLVGRTRGNFTCVTYQPPRTKSQTWARGWLPRAALAPVAPMAAPTLSDWTGSWVHPGGQLTIKAAGGGRLRIEGDQVVPAGRDLNNGSIAATAQPKGGVIAFVEDGTTPFEQPNGADECRVRLQRIGALLLVEDNNDCGGAGVSFTGLYHRR
ncbi:hypothetical protein [Bradyrhizobium sp. BTAi1]|jgi:hypothetical protein|uniref:hypothetical protein n=1 Tax=Bradyrhizobium sp. (strain BTAi1 / ATCC BAA-1182) TaxID=288000 RepID=UPI00005DDC2D|nr:hypothetical protein [Bradyrhizobium sp. BTAi1]ABQ39323.1 putative exported protein of unknown function [Bradyrhizobium sp. BTAi1]